MKTEVPHLIKLIQAQHEMGPEIERELFHNTNPKFFPQKGLAHSRYYFMIAGPYYIRYLMDHIIANVETQQIGRSVLEVIFYEDYMEYEAARQKQMSVSTDQTGLHYN